MSMRDAAGRLALDAAGGGPHPPPGHPLLQFGLAAVGTGQVLEHGRGGVGAAQHGLRELEQRGRLFPGPRGLHGAPGGQMDHAADRDRDGHEQQQSQQLLGLLDGERVNRLGEVPVQQQAGRHRGQHGGPEPAQHRDRHHDDQVDEQLVGQVQVRPPGHEDHRNRRQDGDRQGDTRDAPAHADTTGRARLAGQVSGGHGTGIQGTFRSGPGNSHTPIGAHADQCEPSPVPAEHQTQTDAGEGGNADHDGGMFGGRPGRPQLRVRRAGEPHHREPADAGQ